VRGLKAEAACLQGSDCSVLEKGDIEVHVVVVIVPGGEGIGDVGKGIVEVTEGSFNGNRFPRRFRTRRRGRMGGVP
jgi:hypothetical protein